MDLLASIRKSGSRGGVNFSWDEVAKSSHRENYLGHSVKAPVGRWQKNKDLTWYSKDSAAASSGETAELSPEDQRKEELRRVKEAEEDAMAKALGLPPPVRSSSGANAIEVKMREGFGKTEEEQVGVKKEIKNEDAKIFKGRDHEGNRSHYKSRHHNNQGRGDSYWRDGDRRETRSHRDRSRSRSRGRDRRDGGDRDHRRTRDDEQRNRRRYRSRSRDHQHKDSSRPSKPERKRSVDNDRRRRR